MTRMRFAGIEIGEKTSRLCVLSERGEILVQEALTPSPDSFEQRFMAEPKLRIVMQLRERSLWASQLLTRLGHEVIVAD